MQWVPMIRPPRASRLGHAWSLLILLLCGMARTCSGQGPLLWYLFDEGANPTSVFNAGIAGAMEAPLIGHSLSASGPNGSPALAGSGQTNALVATGYALSLLGDWTLGFAIDTSGATAPSMYIVGDTTSNNTFRVAIGGPLGPNTATISGGGLDDALILGGGGRSGWVHVAWTYESASGTMRGYLDGDEVITVSQPLQHALAGGQLALGNWPGSSTSLANGASLDDFRLYDRALPSNEIGAWVTDAGLTVPRRYQTNQSGARLTLDGRENSRAHPIRSRKLAPTSGVLQLDATLGAGWDLGFTTPELTVALGNGATESLGGQLMNVDSAAPSLGFLGTLTFQSPFPGPLALPFVAFYPGKIALQMIAFDATLPDGAALSAPVELEVLPSPCIVVEANGINNFNGDTQSAFWRIENKGGCGDILEVILDWNQAPGNAQSSMVFDLDQPGLGDFFFCGNGTTLGCRGSYRFGSDVTTGLIYDAGNTYAPGATPNPCDSTVSCGFTVLAPGPGNHQARALRFRFNSFTGSSGFLFDADTDGGLGEHGAAMEGLFVSILTTSGTYSGTLGADPRNPLRSLVTFH